MVKYNCEACNYESNIKSHYNRHLNIKKHKINVEFNGVMNEKSIKKYTKDTQMIQNQKKKIHKKYTNIHK